MRPTSQTASARAASARERYWIPIRDWRSLTVPRLVLTTESALVPATLGKVRSWLRCHWRWICSDVSANLKWRNAASCNCHSFVSTGLTLCFTPYSSPWAHSHKYGLTTYEPNLPYFYWGCQQNAPSKRTKNKFCLSVWPMFHLRHC
jgi:hypothetical protein